MNKEHPKYKAKIKIVEQRWHGWSPEGANIPPKEKIIEKESGSFLLIQESKHERAPLWSEDNQEPKNQIRVDYTQKEGFRLFISWKTPEKVDFKPEFRMIPLKGEEFPVMNYLPLEKATLKVGESFEIKPQTMDAGVTYTITLVDILPVVA